MGYFATAPATFALGGASACMLSCEGSATRVVSSLILVRRRPRKDPTKSRPQNRRTIVKRRTQCCDPKIR
jgi:hypothetical protein